MSDEVDFEKAKREIESFGSGKSIKTKAICSLAIWALESAEGCSRTLVHNMKSNKVRGKCSTCSPLLRLVEKILKGECT